MITFRRRTGKRTGLARLVDEAALSERIIEESRADSGHSQYVLVEVNHCLFLLTLRLIFLSKVDDRSYRSGVEAGTLNLGVDFPDVIGNRSFFLLQPLNALDKGAKLAGGHCL